MDFNFFQKTLLHCSFLLLFSFFISCNSHPSSKEEKENKNLVDSINNLDEAIDNKEVIDSKNNNSERNELEGLLIKRADSFYFTDNFLEAKTLYDMALNTVTDEATKQNVMEKLARTKEKIELHNTGSAMSDKKNSELAGTHKFGVQFIWDKYGTAEIKPTNNANQFSIKGEQYSHNKSEYTLVEGTLNAENPNVLLFEGNIQIFTNDCCGKIEKTGKYTFKRHKGRKFWRLQEFNTLCDQYTCAYYLDIFE